MRKKFITFSLATVMITSAASYGIAAPIGGPAFNAGEDAISQIDESRVFCYSRYSGRFLHWGACGGGYPRVYCKNSYTGRFLHWGHC